MCAASDDRCPACGGSERTFSRGRALDGRGSVLLRVCSTCGHGVLWPPPDAAMLEAAYARAYGDGSAKFRAGPEQAMRWLAVREARALSARLPAHARSVLDVGSGRGLLVNALAAEGVRCTAVERTRDAATSLDPGVTLLVTSELDDAPLPEKSFGAVVFRHVLEHLPDPARALEAARRALAPDGLLLVEVPNFASLQRRAAGGGWLHLDPPRHLHAFTPDSLRRMVRAAGFVVDETRPGGAVHDLLGWACAPAARIGRPPHALYDGLHKGSRLPLTDLALAVMAAPAACALTVATRAAGDAAAVALTARRAPE